MLQNTLNRGIGGNNLPQMMLQNTLNRGIGGNNLPQMMLQNTKHAQKRHRGKKLTPNDAAKYTQ